MSYVGIVLISHSPKVVDGINDMIRQVIKDVPIEMAGGTDENDIGTSIEKIRQAIERADKGQGVMVFYDIGSAKMNAEMAIEMMELDSIKVMEAPLLEGAYVAAVESGMEKNMDNVVAAVSKAFD
ncbi:PTS-dependent dihydroxyacetone kinase phosphotransferase subunit DhaM [Lentibacillus kapialis]|uniref:phosphoenolpyruvate--glycerone phosphotransferase n=1 Tax=Lentibacillus kapialis TaxID=340214 RepID=A0A917Q245_9BACI|nr:dihydroxyacetone kinase phosphoryl donor subunit DhaM [Lentibacillus kapialis]GGK07139.1 PTS-dependent dihydroxyacetone kinase phosphotransferase subunit DhaM [Lentibacillus kapialis]